MFVGSLKWCGLLTLLVLVMGPCACPAATWLEESLQAIESSPGNSQERLLAMMLANVAAYNSDFNLALEMANDSVALAQSLNQPDAIAAALMQRARIRGECQGVADSQHDYMRAVGKYEGKADSRILAHFWWGRALRDWQLVSNETVIGYLQRALAATEESDSATLRLMAEHAMLSHQVASPMNVPTGLNDDVKRLQDFRLRYQGDESWPKQVACLWAERQEQAARGQIEFEFLQHALEVAEQAGVRGLKIMLLNDLVDHYGHLEQNSQAQAYAERALREARLLNSNTALSRQLLQNGRLASQLDDQQLAKELYEEGAWLALKTNEPILQESLYAEVVNQYAQDRDFDKIQSLFMATVNRVNFVDAQREEAVQRSLVELYRERSQKDELKQATSRLEQINSSTHYRLDRLKRTTTLWVSLAVVLACGLGCLMVYRLRRTNRRLIAQIRETEVGREMQKALEQRVSQIERMDSLGMLAGGVAHDFNNLLVGILCNAEVLNARHEDDMSRECIDGIIRSARVAADLSQKMLTYAGKRTSEKVALDINDVIENLMPLLRSGFGSDNIYFFPSHEMATIEGDPSQIEQVILNLVRNAQDVISEEGRVEIRVGRETINEVSSDASLFGQRSTGGEFVYFEVADSGKGIVPSVAQRMFEPFFSTKNGGRGLGLSVVYGCVNKHEGLIRCTSDVSVPLGDDNIRTKIRILLPASTESALMASQSDAFFRSDSALSDVFDRAAPTDPILVVDDENQVLQVICRLLERQEYQCQTFENGVELVDYLQTEQSVACILLDVVMPELDGEGVLKWLQDQEYDVRVVVMSGYSHRNLDDFLLHPNVVGVLEKPFSRRQLIHEIQRACDDGRKTLA